ncbi:hypothetical protein MPTK2_1g13290 [Marchantia polymorpha subsp. ruderalis]
MRRGVAIAPTYLHSPLPVRFLGNHLRGRKQISAKRPSPIAVQNPSSPTRSTGAPTKQRESREREEWKRDGEADIGGQFQGKIEGDFFDDAQALARRNAAEAGKLGEVLGQHRHAQVQQRRQEVAVRQRHAVVPLQVDGLRGLFRQRRRGRRGARRRARIFGSPRGCGWGWGFASGRRRRSSIRRRLLDVPGGLGLRGRGSGSARLPLWRRRVPRGTRLRLGGSGSAGLALCACPPLQRRGGWWRISRRRCGRGRAWGWGWGWARGRGRFGHGARPQLAD